MVGFAHLAGSVTTRDPLLYRDSTALRGGRRCLLAVDRHANKQSGLQEVVDGSNFA